MSEIATCGITVQTCYLRDPSALNDYLKSRISDKRAQYHVLVDEVQYAISLRGSEPPRVYGAPNGPPRMRSVDAHATGSDSRLLSSDAMAEFRGRGGEARGRPLPFADFKRAFGGDAHRGRAEYVVLGGMPLTLPMRTDEQTTNSARGGTPWTPAP